MRTLSFRAASVAALSARLSDVRADDGFKPTLAIVFSSISQNLSDLSATFVAHDIAVFGCTTAGEIVDDELGSLGVAVLLLDIATDKFSIKTVPHIVGRPFERSREMGLFARAAFARPAVLLLSSGITNDAEQVVYGLKAGLNMDVPIFGGLAGDDLKLNRTFVLTEGAPISDGISVLVFDNDAVELTGLATSGWEAIGIEHTITAAEGNVLQSINGQPALDVFLKYFGYFDNTENEGLPISTISAQYPLQIEREGGTRVLRTPMFASEEDRSLVLGGSVRVGEKFRFSISPGVEVIDQTVENFRDFHQDSPAADALLLFSCKGRHAALGPLLEDEISGIHQHWNKPMIGFLSYGEFGPTKYNGCDFHNETCSMVAIREK